MKNSILAIAGLVLLSVATQAQNVSIKLTDDQYKQIKEEVQRENQNDKVHNLDWADFGKYAEANKKLKERPGVVFMGNSITELWNRLHPNFFTKNHFLCRGISGQTSCEMLVRFRPDVINLHPKVVIINAGINDIAHNNGVITIENVMNNIISMAQLAKANHISPILTSVLPSNRFPWRPEIVPTELVINLNKMIKAYAANNHFTYINYYDAMVDSEKGLPEKYSHDGVHPTPEGYNIMEAIVLKTLKK